MAQTPKSVKVDVQIDPEVVAKIRQEGVEEGLKQGRQEIVDWLQNAYINDPGRPDRGTPKGEAILELARDAHAHFIAKMTQKIKRKKK